MKEIDQKIKPLVDILNKIPYITTFSSCEAHYDSDDLQDHKAEVLFRMPEYREDDFKDLSTVILKETVLDWADVQVEIHKNYYVEPHDDKLRIKYGIIITPFPREMSIQEKRIYTDMAIDKIVDAVKEYQTKTFKKHP